MTSHERAAYRHGLIVNRYWAFALSVIAPLVIAFPARAENPAVARHPVGHLSGLLSPAEKPANVPANYVITRSGFFHPSCVVLVRSDEIVGRDLVVRGLDRLERGRIEPCAYPSFSLKGNPRIESSAAQSGMPTKAPNRARPFKNDAVTYDGYIVDYYHGGTLPRGLTLTTEWTVPESPKKVVDQDIAFFNDILTDADGGDILQPVLDFNGTIAGHWIIESEHCCVGGNDMQTEPVPVAVGDRIRGIVAGTDCSADGSCNAWAVTTMDLTSGESTVLNTTAGVPTGIQPGALESYGVKSCDMFPFSGRTTFDNALMSNGAASDAGANDSGASDGGGNDAGASDAGANDGGAPVLLTYKLETLNGVAAEVPRNCGYGGSVAGNAYTLIYGPSPDAGAGDASAEDASADGSIAVGDAGESSDDASIANPGASDASGAANQDNPVEASASAGCSCDTVRSESSPKAITLFFAFAMGGAGIARRRRAARNG